MQGLFAVAMPFVALNCLKQQSNVLIKRLHFKSICKAAMNRAEKCSAEEEGVIALAV